MSNTNAELKAEVDKLRLALERSNTPQKELMSAYFCDKYDDERKLTGLSETMKSIETKSPDIAEKMLVHNDNQRLKATEFNTLVAKALTQYFYE